MFILCSLYKLHSWKLNQHSKVRAEELPGVTVIKVREEVREVKRDGETEKERRRETERRSKDRRIIELFKLKVGPKFPTNN